MCYAHKIVDKLGRDLSPDFDGQFDCARYNCGGCDHELVHGEPPKRNLGFRTNFDFSRTLISTISL